MQFGFVKIGRGSRVIGPRRLKVASEFSGGGRKWGEEEKLNDLGLGDWETQTQTQKNLPPPLLTVSEGGLESSYPYFNLWSPPPSASKSRSGWR